MKLTDKHGGKTQKVEYNSFIGGLNTSVPEAEIQPNELSEAVNVELDIETGMLKTVDGTETIYEDGEKNFTDAAYDRINSVLLLVSVEDGERKLYAYIEGGMLHVGNINGQGVISTAEWEDGLLIASGGKMQYFKPDGAGWQLETIETSPDNCRGVFVRKGRIATWYSDELHFSAVGDETNWTEDNNDASAAKWLQVGYKDGGVITGVGNLYDSVIVFKNNNHAYRIVGDFPDWQVTEFGRTVSCYSPLAVAELKNDLRVFGEGGLVAITPTDEYGDMKAAAIDAKVKKNVKVLPNTTKAKYIAGIEQIWLIHNSQKVLVLDVPHNAFFERRFNDGGGVPGWEVVDAVATPFATYIIRARAVCKIVADTMRDVDAPLPWYIQTKAILADNSFVIKRARVDTTPLYTNYDESIFTVGGVALTAGLPWWADHVWGDDTIVYGSKRKLHKWAEPPRWGEIVYANPFYLTPNTDYVCSYVVGTIRSEMRCVDRARIIRVSGRGAGGSLNINSISFDIAEV